ncbi:MAG: hypothetical protein J7L15_00150 [Clostridiales bacterium]|nr:hypothetical protein [Clostridiales bacterium]
MANPEPLNGKIKICIDDIDFKDDKINMSLTGVIKIDDVKSACEFYLKYFNKPKVFVKENPEYEQDLDKFILDRLSPDAFKYDLEFFDYDGYNEWLFKLAFKDVLDGGDRQ